MLGQSIPLDKSQWIKLVLVKIFGCVNLGEGHWVVEYKLAVALPQDHTQSCKISIDMRLPFFVQVSAIISFEALLSHLTCNRNY